MSNDDIIRMAREAGFSTGTRDYADGNGGHPFVTPVASGSCLPEIERFAALVEAKASEKEREPLTNEQIREVLYKHQKSSYEACGIDTEGMKLMDDSLFTEVLGYVKAVLAAHGIK